MILTEKWGDNPRVARRRITRTCAKLHGEFPLLFFLGPFIAGQFLSFYLPPAVAGTLVFLAVIGAYLSVRRRAAWGAICAGVLSGLCGWGMLNDSPGEKFSSEEIYAGIVDDVPRYPRPGGMRFLLRFGVLDQRSGRVTIEHAVLCRAVDLPWRAVSAVEAGTVLAFRANFVPLRPSFDPFTYESGLLRRGISAKCKIRYAAVIAQPNGLTMQRIRGSIAERVRDALGDNESSGLFLSMALGVRDQLSLATEQAFRRAGVAHLLVVSGYQVTLVFALACGVMRTLGLRIERSAQLKPFFGIRAALGVGVLGALLYLLVVGIEGSTARAAIAAFFVAISAVSERGRGFFQAILFALFVLAVFSPGCYLDPGVQLTFAALGGLALGAGHRGSWIAKAFLACFYASLATSVVGALRFGAVSIAGFFLNAWLAPLLSLVSCNFAVVPVVALFLGIDPDGVMLSYVTRFLLFWRDQIVVISRWSWASFDLTPLEGAAYALFGFLILTTALRRRIFEFQQLRGVAE